MNIMSLRLVLYYFLSVNLLTFIAYGIDKHKAIRNGHRNKQLRRIPEASLLLLSGSGRGAASFSPPVKVSRIMPYFWLTSS